tara:strand:+ start:143 stop:319 length:177 start_codon:yes stop_codon:yes gene_type:complete
MGLLEYAAIAIIVYIALSMILKFTLIAMYLYGMYQFMKDDTDQTQSSVDSDEFNPDYI